MRRVIYKYAIGKLGGSILVPRGSTILTVQLQDERPVVWINVPILGDAERARLGDIALDFYLVHTGETLPSTLLHYVGTLQCANGIVLHVLVREVSEGESAGDRKETESCVS